MRTGSKNKGSPVKRRRMVQDGVVEDIHSRLNVVYHQDVVRINSVSRLISEIDYARSQSMSVAVSGGRHAMGGQQFVMDGLLLDMRSLNAIIDLDRKKGLVKVQAGIQWNELINELALIQKDQDYQEIWSIVQKPTGADNLTIGGCLSANIHGRGLKMRPFVQDIVEFELLTANSELLSVSRQENPDLFRLVIGGYGLFGVVTTITLKLKRRLPMRRYVEEINSDKLIARLDELIDDGHEYGDFQFSIDSASDDFLTRGIL
ncbi:MAG: FAD-binding oxidoreductase, partial [Candidatus Obscuribacterales bacterium]|nr:FAD-binding oxidoreductase [Candidatus Obscuribacterales bacterium]